MAQEPAAVVTSVAVDVYPGMHATSRAVAAAAAHLTVVPPAQGEHFGQLDTAPALAPEPEPNPTAARAAIKASAAPTHYVQRVAVAAATAAAAAAAPVGTVVRSTGVKRSAVADPGDGEAPAGHSNTSKRARMAGVHCVRVALQNPVVLTAAAESADAKPSHVRAASYATNAEDWTGERVSDGYRAGAAVCGGDTPSDRGRAGETASHTANANARDERVDVSERSWYESRAMYAEDLEMRLRLAVERAAREAAARRNAEAARASVQNALYVAQRKVMALTAWSSSIAALTDRLRSQQLPRCQNPACSDRRPASYAWPCGHLAFCSACGDAAERRRARCPIRGCAMQFLNGRCFRIVPHTVCQPNNRQPVASPNHALVPSVTCRSVTRSSLAAPARSPAPSPARTSVGLPHTRSSALVRATVPQSSPLRRASPVPAANRARPPALPARSFAPIPRDSATTGARLPFDAARRQTREP